MNKPNGHEISFVSLNCRGLNKNLKRKLIFQKLRKYSVIALQETYVTTKVVSEWEKEWGGQLLYSPGTCHSKGILTLINKNVDAKNINIFYKTDRVLGINLDIHNKTYTFINVYGPNLKSQRHKFFNSLYSAFNSSKPSNLIVAGDFNIVKSNAQDIISGKNHDETDIRSFNEWVEYCELIDIWRNLHSNIKDFTWSKTTPFTARRLDFILCDEIIQSKVQTRNSLWYRP